MNLRSFDDISLISSPLGVSPVGVDTRLLASIGLQLTPSTALDLGTGSGFIAVALSRAGIQCTASDTSIFAISSAMKLAEHNGCDVRFVHSDLFSNIRGTYDLILFNPPFGHSRYPRFARILDVVKSAISKDNSFIRRVIFELVRPARSQMIKRFLLRAHDFLQPNGNILLFIHARELMLVSGWNSEVVASEREFRLVKLWRSEAARKTTSL